MESQLKEINSSPMTLEFIGCGNSTSEDFGNSSAVITLANNKKMVIDFGFTAYRAYKNKFKSLPDAVYITHTHLDHIGGLQSLYYDALFTKKDPIKLFIHYRQVGMLHNIMGRLENTVAGHAVNFYDAFQLTPVSDEFWFENTKFSVFEARHHAPHFSHGISVKGRFAFTGDTKPIPEALLSIASQGEVIFHDLSVHEQPSHTFLKELKSYPDHLLRNMIFYHLHSNKDVEMVESEGYRCAQIDTVYEI